MQSAELLPHSGRGLCRGEVASKVRLLDSVQVASSARVQSYRRASLYVQDITSKMTITVPPLCYDGNLWGYIFASSESLRY